MLIPSVAPVTSVPKSLARWRSTNTTRKKSNASSIHPRKLAMTTLRCSAFQTSFDSTPITPIFTTPGEAEPGVSPPVGAGHNKEYLGGPAATATPPASEHSAQHSVPQGEPVIQRRQYVQHGHTE